MKRAKYLRPYGLETTGLDAAVKAWLATEGIQVVGAGEYDLMVCLPYDGGYDYYHRDVSIAMAELIIQQLASGGEFRWIVLRSTEIELDWTAVGDCTAPHENLVYADLGFEDNGYAGKPTLAIMTPDEVADVHQTIRKSRQLNDRNLGDGWKPRPPRKPWRSFYSDQVITFTIGESCP